MCVVLPVVNVGIDSKEALEDDTDPLFEVLKDLRGIAMIKRSTRQKDVRIQEEESSVAVITDTQTRAHAPINGKTIIFNLNIE